MDLDWNLGFQILREVIQYKTIRIFQWCSVSDLAVSVFKAEPFLFR